MRAIVMVLTAFGICVAFVMFFALFTQIPLLMLGLFLILALNMTRRRRPVAADSPATPDFEVDDE